MQIFLPRQTLGTLIFFSPARSLSEQRSVGPACSEPNLNQLDLSSFQRIAKDTLGFVNTGNFRRAKSRIKDLESDWDRAEARLRPRSPEQWRKMDKAIDAACSNCVPTARN